jgi:hypothetical protein
MLGIQEPFIVYGTNSTNYNLMGFSGDVFDVTKGRGWYTPGGSYHFFAGRDAARAYATGCFKEHLTHDLRGLSEGHLKVNIYRESKMNAISDQI